MCADRNSTSHAGYHSFKGDVGRFEVFWSEVEGEGVTAQGWYWQACFEGCLPDGEASGPFNTSAMAFLDARSE